jgi:hypothetical protein
MKGAFATRFAQAKAGQSSHNYRRQVHKHWKKQRPSKGTTLETVKAVSANRGSKGQAEASISPAPSASSTINWFGTSTALAHHVARDR